MKFIETPVKEFERKECAEHKKIIEFLEGFLSSNVSTAMVVYEPGEYSSPMSMFASLRQAANKSNMPIKVRYIGENVYIIRK